MSKNSQVQSFQEDERPRHAGFLIRFVASLVMGIPIAVPACLIFGLDNCLDAVFGAFDPDREETGGAASNIAQVLATLILAVATVWLWVNSDGRTPGKKATRTMIVTWPEYGPLSYKTSVVRMLVAVVSALPLFAGYVVIALMIGLRADKRGYHDLITGTCVVYDARE
jgi:uncharacterized RDD family membrane protein YckC